MDQNHQLWVHPVSALALNFERLFKECLCLTKDVPLVEILTNFSHICRRKGPEPPQRGHFMDAALPRKHLEIHNLATTNATLMKLTTIMYLHKTFNLAKDWGVIHRA